MRRLEFGMIVAITSLLFGVMPARARPPTMPLSTQVQQGKQPINTVTVNVVDRTTKAINYKHLDKATTIGFRGTSLQPDAKGKATVESKKGYIRIEAEFEEVQSPMRYGFEFLTYVLWAITPEGRATSLGELVLDGKHGNLKVTTEFQAFGMIVTAEPYFAVSQPSDAVVMENFVMKETTGKVEEIDAKYELLQRGEYTANVLHADLKKIELDKKTPLDLYEARNAVQIAKWAGADVSAAESFQKASKLLAQAEGYQTAKSGTKSVAQTAREAVQTAEDARLITMKVRADARLAQERAASAGRETAANAAAANARADANSAERGRLLSQTQAELRLSQERAASAGREATANAAAADARADANDAERDRAASQFQAERARLDAQLASERAADAARAEAERARQDAASAAQRAANDRAAQEAANQLAKATALEKSEREKRALRDTLKLQLNAILQTRDTVRGLMVNMSDVLFDTGQYALKPGAREKLSRISGILLAYPGLKLEVEGHTDSVGTADLNMRLSENRATSVLDFLISQGIATNNIGSRGFGKDQPVATNDTAAGRQQNRRVELIVSGDVIGGTISSSAQIIPLQ